MRRDQRYMYLIAVRQAISFSALQSQLGWFAMRRNQRNMCLRVIRQAVSAKEWPLREIIHSLARANIKSGILRKGRELGLM
jgi:hypothetical protein